MSTLAAPIPESPAPPQRRSLLAPALLLAIVLLALSVRVAHYSERANSQGWGRQVLDYASMAQNIIRGNGYYTSLPSGLEGISQPTRIYTWEEFASFDQGGPRRTNAYALPGYPYLIAAVWTVSSVESYASMQFFQSLLDSLVGCFVLFAVLAAAGRLRAGLIAALGYALAAPLIIQSALILPDALGSPLNLIVVGCAVLGFSWGRPLLWAFAAGLALGLGNWFRGDSIFLLPLLPLAVLVVTRLPFNLRLAWGGVFVGACLLPAVGLGFFHQHVYGEFHLTRPGAGILLWEGIGQQDNPWGIAPVPGRNLDAAAGALMAANGYSYGTWDGDAFLLREAIGHMQERPGWFVKPTLQRFWRVITLQKPPEATTTLPDAVIRATRIVGPSLPLLGALGLFLLRDRPLLRNVLVVVWLSRVLPFAFLRDELRFEIILVPVYLCLIAVVADEALRRGQTLLSRLRQSRAAPLATG